MSEFLQGLLVCLIGGSFFALILAPFMLSGRISREENETGAPEGMARHFIASEADITPPR